MGAHSFKDLEQHVGHRIVVVRYGRFETKNKKMLYHTYNVSCECETCNEVILTYDEGENDYEES